MKQKYSKTEMFERMPVGKALLTMASPTIISQLITMIYNLADTFFIGLSDDPYKVAAASVVGVLFFMLNALSNLFGVGGGSLLSRLLGEKKEEDARRVGAFSIYGSMVIAAVYSLVCLLFTDPLAYLLGGGAASSDGAANRLFDVEINGVKVLRSFDIAAEVSAEYGIIKKFAVDIDGGNGLSVDFLPIKGEPTLCAIRIYRVF